MALDRSRHGRRLIGLKCWLTVILLGITRSWAYVAPNTPQQRVALPQTSCPGASPQCPTRSRLTWKLQSSTSSALNAISFKGPDRKDVQAMASAAAFVAIDISFRRLFRALSIAFPSSLAACCCLLVTLLTLPTSVATRGISLLQPGATLLAKFLPVFFVPSLISLPLADSVGSTMEIIKIATVIVGGLIGSLLTTAFAVQAVRQASSSTNASFSTVASSSATPSTGAPKKAFTDELFNFLCFSTAVTAARTLSLVQTVGNTAIASPWLAACFLSTTLNAFVFGARLPSKFKQLIHPLVTCTGITWTSVALWGTLLRTSFTDVLPWYTLRNSAMSTMGAGNILLFLLGPAVVSLAVSMYERRQLMRDNLAAVATALAVSTAGGLVGTAWVVRLLQIASPYLRLSLLSRNITSPLAMAIAGMLGADVSLAVSMVVVTGLLGANFGAALLDMCGIKDPIARGLSMGAAAHGLGTAALANDEPEAFPFAAIAMALTATAATVTVSIPAIRTILIRLALNV